MSSWLLATSTVHLLSSQGGQGQGSVGLYRCAAFAFLAITWRYATFLTFHCDNHCDETTTQQNGCRYRLICVYQDHFCFFLCFFPGVILHSRVTGACPVTTDFFMRANVRTICLRLCIRNYIDRCVFLSPSMRVGFIQLPCAQQC